MSRGLDDARIYQVICWRLDRSNGIGPNYFGWKEVSQRELDYIQTFVNDYFFCNHMDLRVVNTMGEFKPVDIYYFRARK